MDLKGGGASAVAHQPWRIRADGIWAGGIRAKAHQGGLATSGLLALLDALSPLSVFTAISAYRCQCSPLSVLSAISASRFECLPLSVHLPCRSNAPLHFALIATVIITAVTTAATTAVTTAATTVVATQSLLRRSSPPSSSRYQAHTSPPPFSGLCNAL